MLDHWASLVQVQNMRVPLEGNLQRLVVHVNRNQLSQRGDLWRCIAVAAEGTDSCSLSKTLVTLTDVDLEIKHAEDVT